MARRVGAGALVAMAMLAGVAPSTARAQGTPSTSNESDATVHGREAFLRGVKLAHDQQWGDALTAFQEAAAARDAPYVQHNIAFCERALGHYVAAYRVVLKVLKDTRGLSPSQVEEAKGYLAEFERLLVRVKVHLEPLAAKLAVDGRPLTPSADEPGVVYAGLAPAGPGSAGPSMDFVVVLDPGAHVFEATREGHRDVAVPRSYRPGESTSLDLHLDVLPATIALRAEPASAIVRIDGREVGLAPIEFERPAGQYGLEVVHDDFETYKATLDLKPGQRAEMTATLTPYHAPLTKQWWFWAGAATVVVGGALLTYALTRPAPQPPPYDSGSANWLVQTKSFP